MLISFMEKKNITTYSLAKKADIPYSTLSDLVNGKTDIKSVSATVLYKLSKALDVSMEKLYLDEPDTQIFYLYNVGRRVYVRAAGKDYSYEGPKNLVGFKRVNEIKNDTVYVDTFFLGEDGRIFNEEDYLDLRDLLAGHESILDVHYEVLISKPGESRSGYLMKNAILVSDNMAIMENENSTDDYVVEIVNVKHNKEKMLMRLKDYAVLFSNMSKRMENRALETVQRNSELIISEVMERKHA